MKPHAAPLLSFWYCLAEQPCDEFLGGVGCYRVDWSHEQYLLDYLPSLGFNVGLPQEKADYNGIGRLVRHLFWKDANDARILTTDVKAFVQNKGNRSKHVPRPLQRRRRVELGGLGRHLRAGASAGATPEPRR